MNFKMLPGSFPEVHIWGPFRASRVHIPVIFDHQNPPFLPFSSATFSFLSVMRDDIIYFAVGLSYDITRKISREETWNDWVERGCNMMTRTRFSQKTIMSSRRLRKPRGILSGGGSFMTIFQHSFVRGTSRNLVDTLASLIFKERGKQ